jgi:hypothetical protein
MPWKTRRDLLAALGATATVGLAGCGGGGEETTEPAADTETMGGMTDTPTATPSMADTATPTETATETGTPGATANVRVAHFSPNAPNVDVYVDGEQVLSNVPYRTISEYLEVPVGTRTITITAVGDPDTVPFEGDVTVEEADYTVAAVGSIGADENAFQPLVLEDDNSEFMAEDTARVRVIHASPDAPAVDVTASGSVLFENVSFGDSGYVELPNVAATVRVRAATETNDGPIVAAAPFELAGSTVYTIFASGYLAPEDAPADTPFSLTPTVDSGEGGGGAVDPANVRVGHFSPDAPNVDVYLDGGRVLADVPYRAVSGYTPIAPGATSVEITAAGDPDTVVFSQELDIAAGDYTVAAVGELQSDDSEFRPLVLPDDNSDPGGDSARVRLVHASPDAPAVDVTTAANGSAVFDGVAFGESSTGTVPSGDFTLEVRGDTEANDGDVVADFPVTLAGNTVYTAFAVGYLTPDDENVSEAFDLEIAEDASY